MESLDNFFNDITSQPWYSLNPSFVHVMMFLEWLHYTYFGMSIVDRIVSAAHVLPFLNSSKNKESENKARVPTDAKPFRVILMLFRGAEYYRYKHLT